MLFTERERKNKIKVGHLFIFFNFITETNSYIKDCFMINYI